MAHGLRRPEYPLDHVPVIALEIIVNLLKNAFVKAIMPGLKPAPG